MDGIGAERNGGDRHALHSEILNRLSILKMRRVILSVVLGQRPGSRLSPLEMNGRLEMTVGMPTASGAA